MGELKSALTKDDVGLLVEAVNDWEAIGNHEYHVLNIVKRQPMPNDDDESYEFIKEIKDHFRKREKEITSSRAVRQERAILTKAKLILIQQDLSTGQLFENSQNIPESTRADCISADSTRSAPVSYEKRALELAEFYIKDLGVWSQYQKFLAEQGEIPQPNSEEESCDEENDSDSEWYHT